MDPGGLPVTMLKRMSEMEALFYQGPGYGTLQHIVKAASARREDAGAFLQGNLQEYSKGQIDPF